MNTLRSLIVSQWQAITCLLLLGITCASLWPLEQLPSVPGTDKTHHLIAYSLLMFPTALRKPKYWILYGLVYAAFSGMIELLQPLVNRYAEWSDLLANIAGIVCGILLAAIINRWHQWTQSPIH